MVALTLLCASLVACAGATKPNQQQTVSQPTAEAQPEDNAGNVGINSPDSGRAEKDKEAREELERQQKEEAERQQREEEERRQEEQAHSGNGTYILSDGTEVHTDHNIEDYIERNNYRARVNGVPTNQHEFILDIGKMCYDIFGSGELEGYLKFSVDSMVSSTFCSL